MSNESVPTAFAVLDRPPVVQVVAPSTLSEGYTFHATFDGTVFPVVVPPGGVQKGQRFAVPFVTDVMSSEATPLFSSSSATAASLVPQEHFKDGICSCFALGPLHISLWNAVFCPAILMAQVLTRMKLDWCGNENGNWNLTFRRVMMVVIAYWILSSLLSPPRPYIVKYDDGRKVVIEPSDTFWRPILYQLVTTGFGVYNWVVLMKLRYFIRERYRIRNTTIIPGMLEDFCCAFWCGCCTVAQLARHTADYERERAICCSETGLPPTADIPVVIV